MQKRYIGKRALLARINRHLAKSQQQLYRSRSKADMALYDYFIADKKTGAVLQGIKSDNDLIAYAREHEHMKSAEEMVGD